MYDMCRVEAFFGCTWYLIAAIHVLLQLHHRFLFGGYGNVTHQSVSAACNVLGLGSIGN